MSKLAKNSAITLSPPSNATIKSSTTPIAKTTLATNKAIGFRYIALFTYRMANPNPIKTLSKPSV